MNGTLAFNKERVDEFTCPLAELLAMTFLDMLVEPLKSNMSLEEEWIRGKVSTN